MPFHQFVLCGQLLTATLVAVNGLLNSKPQKISDVPYLGFKYLLFVMTGRIQKLFNIKYPIVQAGMVWCSGWRLASAVSNAGGLGLIGSGSMYPETLQHHIRQCKLNTP